MADCSPIEFGDDLRERLFTNLAAHDVRSVPVDERKRAAVAVVVVDSDLASDADDPYQATEEEMSIIPGGAGVSTAGCATSPEGRRSCSAGGRRG